MFTGVAVLGVLAGSLADLFKIGGDQIERPAAGPEAPVHEELASVQSELQRLETRLGDIVERVRSG